MTEENKTIVEIKPKEETVIENKNPVTETKVEDQVKKPEEQK